MDKLKILLMNHGEKLVAGICAMFGFLALTSASWKADHRSPITIEQDVTQAKAQIEQNQWPEEDQTLFEQIPDVLELTSDENKELVQASKFTLIPFSQSPNRLKEKRTAPMVIAPEDAVADGIILRLAMPPTEDEEEGEASETAEGEGEGEGKDEEMSEDEEAEALLARKFGLRTGTAAAAGAEGYPGGAGGSFPGAAAGGGGYPGGSPGGPGGGPGGALGSGGGPGGMGAPGMGAPGSGAPGMGMGGGYESDDYGGSDLYGAYGTSLDSKKKNVRVNAGISVRLIVDLQKQRNIIRKALHLSGDYQAAQKYIQYIDLHVERRQKQDGPNPWSNEWEPVSSEDLGEILKDSFGIDKDIVSPAVTRSTITMPLPRRAAGTWLPEEASHPRLENFELSAEEKAMFDKWNQIVKERLDKEKADKPAEVEQKGFSSYAQSSVDMSSSMYSGGGGSAYGSGYSGNDSSAFEGMYDDYEQQSGGKLTAEQKELLDTTRATADLRLLLVRFMDFTVERGYSYQYRVRVEMKNPNYRHPLDELEDPAIGTEPTLMSDWSTATQEVYVPVAHRLYLTDVEAAPGTPEKVDITVYTDTTETGMPVMGDVKVLMGLPIAGRRNLEVVDLTTDVLEEREVAIGTDDILSAAEGFGRLSTSDHPDLKAMLDRLPRGTDPIADEICIVDSTGDIHLRSVGDKASSEKEDRNEFAGILKLYEAWKPKPVSDANSFFGAGEGGGDAGYGGGSEGLGMSPGSSSGGGYYGGGGGEGEAGGSSRSSRRGSSRRGGR